MTPASTLRAPDYAPQPGAATSGTASISKDGRPAHLNFVFHENASCNQGMSRSRPQQPSIGRRAISYVRQARNSHFHVASPIFVFVRRQFHLRRAPFAWTSTCS